jgi:hypothetical protein
MERRADSLLAETYGVKICGDEAPHRHGNCRSHSVSESLLSRLRLPRPRAKNHPKVGSTRTQGGPVDTRAGQRKPLLQPELTELGHPLFILDVGTLARFSAGLERDLDARPDLAGQSAAEPGRSSCLGSAGIGNQWSGAEVPKTMNHAEFAGVDSRRADGIGAALGRTAGLPRWIRERDSKRP